jgi:uncharacterized protein (PEP-CTERM system associated)
LVYYDCPSGREPYIPGALPSSPACVLRAFVLSDPTLVDQTYISKSLTGTVSYSLRRNTWSLSVYNTRREFLGMAGGGNDEIGGVQASWSLRPAAHTTFTLTGGMSKNESSGTSSREDDLWNLGLVATHQFLPKVSGSVEARHQQRKSNQVGGGYAENSVAARLNMSF